MKLNKKIIRTILEHKSQYLGSIILIALSCLVFSMFNIFGTNIIQNLTDFKTNYNQEDASFLTMSDIDHPDELEKEYSLLLEERYYLDTQYDARATLRLLTPTQKINRYYVSQGTDIEKENDVLLDPAFAKAHNISIGDRMVSGNKELFVTGFATIPDYIYILKSETDMMKNPNTFGIGIVTSNLVKQDSASNRFYSVLFLDSSQDVNTRRTAFKKKLNESNVILQWIDKEDNLRMSFIENDLKGIEPMGKVLPVVILFISCTMVTIILSRLLKQEYIQIGVLYALGYRKKEILLHYLRYSILMAFIGGIIGTLTGAFLVIPYLNFAAEMFNLPIFKITYEYQYPLFSILLPFLFLIPATLLIVNKSLNLSPLQLLKNGKAKNHVGFLEKHLKLAHFSFKARFKLREILRNLPRVAFLLFGVVVASSLVLMGFTMKSSMDQVVNGSLTDVYQYEYSYTFNTFQTGKLSDAEPASFAPFTAKLENNEKLNILLNGILPNSKMLHLYDTTGNKLPLNQVIITQVVADKLSLKAGDTFTIKNSMSQKEITLTIGEIANYHLGALIYMPLEEMNQLCDYPKDSYLTLYSSKKLDIEPSILMSSMSKSELMEGYDLMMKPFYSISFAIGVFAFIIGLIVLYVVISMLIQENSSNISLLKILGYRKKEICSLILNNFTLFVLLGFVLAVPAVLISLNQFFSLMTKDMSMTIPIVIQPLDTLIGFIIVIFIYQLAKFLNKKKIDRISMADSLKNRNE
jgi:putative ABC transport system permease protein